MEKERELVLRLNEAETETVAAMNSIMSKHGLPCFLYEPIIDKIHRQLINGKAEEIESAKVRAIQEVKK